VNAALRDRLSLDGASWDPKSGRPIDFGEPVRELEAALSACALAERSDLGRSLATGPDILDLLHRLTTADLASLAELRGKPAVMTTPKGRIVQRLFVHRLGGGAGVLLVSGPGGAERVRSHLESYTFREDTGLTDVTETWSCLALLGPKARDAVAAAGLPTPDAYVSARGSLEGVELQVLGHDGLSELGLSIVVPGPGAPVVWGHLVEAISRTGGRPAGYRAVAAWRVLRGLPENGTELTENHNPLEAGLWDAVSFSKGCYVGQEVVARLNTYDKVTRDLRGLVLTAEGGPPEPRTPLFAGTRRVGEVTSALIPPGRSSTAALGYVRREHSTAGTELTVGEDGGLRASVVELPFDEVP
jgi:folate-binding protein YgfZ